MPLPPAPTQRASLISNQSIADHQKAIPSPVLSSNTGTVSKKSTPKPDLVLLKSGYQESEMALPAKAVTPAAQKKIKATKKSNGPTKLFVLDTNVLMHDPMCLFQFEEHDIYLPISLPQGKADNQILGVVQALGPLHSPREVVLVSKDINMRVKARALGLAAEDYQNDKVLEDGDLMYSGAMALPPDFWNRHSKAIESWQQGSHTFYRLSGPLVPSLLINQFVYLEAPGEPSLHARVTEIRGKTAVLKTLKDFGNAKNAVWGVATRNREQNFAMNMLMDPDVDFVTLAGTAGTGKTLMALAAGLTQVLDDRRYTEIIMTRATVSVGEDIGFLPGTEEEKMGPWMGALDDNLEFLAKGDGGNAGEWGRAATNELIRSRIKIKSMNFMRGRTFMNKYVIIDEAQNLTPKQMKTLITRAGPGTKIICMGNLAQIDTPYLTEGSSGLTYAVDRFKGWAHGGHITLARGERSRLADFASDVL